MKNCKICRVEFKPKAVTSVTCGSEECKRKNYILNRDKETTGGQDLDVIMKNKFLVSSFYGG